MERGKRIAASLRSSQGQDLHPPRHFRRGELCSPDAAPVRRNRVDAGGFTLSVGFADSSPIGRAKPWVFCLRMRGRLPFSERPAYRRTAVVAATASPLALPLGELSPQVTEREYRLRLLFPMLRRFRHNAAAAGERSSPLRDGWRPWRRIPPGTVPPPHPKPTSHP